MIVVDTSVWIDLLSGARTPESGYLTESITAGASIGITGIILLELLQGASQRDAKRLLKHMLPFPMVPLDEPVDYAFAAELYRRTRDAGAAVRRSVDCLIAAPVIRHGYSLLHRDRDFERIAGVSDLRIVAGY